MNLENKKQIAIILLAIGLGLVAAIATGKYIESSVAQKAQAYKQEFEKNFEKKAMAPLIGEIQKLQNDIKRVKDSQASLAKQQSQQAQRIANAPRAAAVELKPKEIVDSTVFSVITPPGKRAVTINLDTLAAVGGLINPGDRVDIIAQLDIPDTEGAKKNPVTSVLFQNIQVLAIGTNFKPIGNALTYQAQQKARALTITLAMSPEEAGLMTFAKTNGKLNLSLRSPEERGKQVLEVASWDALSNYVLENQGTELTIPKKKPKPVEKKEEDDEEEEEIVPTIQIFRGGQEL